MQEAFILPQPNPAQKFKGTLSEWLANSNSVKIDNILHLSFNTELDIVPAGAVIRRTSASGATALPAQIEIAGVSLTTLSEEHAHKNGDSLIYRYPLAAAIWAGDYVIMPKALIAQLPPELLPENPVGVSGIHYAYGRIPERHYDILSTAVLSQLDLQGRSVIEFGAGYGHKLLLSAKHGAVAGIGLELPEIFRQGRSLLRADLEFNFPGKEMHTRIKLVDRNILSRKNTEDEAMPRLWKNKISGEYPLPSVAIMSLGPSYDADTNASETPHVRALELALSLPSVETIVAGGYAREYTIAGRILSDHYAESDALAREMLYEFFEDVVTYELHPRGLHTLVATKRRA